MSPIGPGWQRYWHGELTDVNVAIIGAGKTGYKRAQALQKFDDCHLKLVIDTNKAQAQKLANEFGGAVETDWQKAVDDENIEVLIVSTYNKSLAPICIEAFGSKKHVLCEKPVGRTLKETTEVVQTAFKHGVIFKVGFNHRFHPGILKAKELFDKKEIGELFFLRCRYGYGGRLGFEKEWRANKDLSGGGELLDQGIHVVDLFRCFVDRFDTVFGYTQTYFWGKEVEDNAFMMFKKRDGVIATMHVSSTQWKNLFLFEIFGEKGYLIVEGLGGSYGVESLRIGKRRPESGPPDEQIISFPGEDTSWEEEWKIFLRALKSGERQHIGNGADAYKASLMIEKAYESARTQKVVKL